MKMSLSPDLIYTYIMKLVYHHFPDGASLLGNEPALFDMALMRVEYCFSNIKKKYYFENGGHIFDHLHGDHMATLLYFYSNTIWRETGYTDLPTRLVNLNKIMHGIDLFYSRKMPDIFLLVHPIGTVLGDAEYGNYLVVYQNCTIGSVSSKYPKLGQETVLYANSTVIGDCSLGNNVVIAANSLLVDTNVPSNTVVSGQFPVHRFSFNTKTVFQRCFE